MAMTPCVVGAIAQQWVARRSDARDERRWHAAACAMASALGWLLLPLVSGNPTLSLVALIATAAGTFPAVGPLWSMPALYLSAKAAPGGIALIGALAALMIVGAVTVVAIGHHNRNRASAVPQLKVAARIQRRGRRV